MDGNKSHHLAVEKLDEWFLLPEKDKEKIAICSCSSKLINKYLFAIYANFNSLSKNVNDSENNLENLLL